MTTPRFSVVIPTRERAATLRSALRTCLDQDFDDYEIIVSDNDSSPPTQAVVVEAADAKIRYVRTPGPLAMSSNWDFAVSHARGEYVVLIGDDDGLLPHALRELDRLARESSLKAIRWDPAYYTWPSFAIAGQGDYLRVPVGRGVREVESGKAIRAVIEFLDFYTVLPMLYNAAVHRSVLDAMRAKTGRVFPHAVPDVYSGFAVAAAAGRFLSTDVPMSVSGQSGASNGVATLLETRRTAVADEFRTLNARGGFQSDPRVPNLPAFPHVPVADAFLFAKSHWFPTSVVELDRRQFVSGCVANLRVATETDWQTALGQLRDSLADDPESRAWFDAEIATVPYRAPAPLRLRPERLGFDGEYLQLDAAAFGITDVAGAAGLCERLLNYRRDGVAYSTGDAGLRATLAAKVRDLHRVCADRQQVIDKLAAACAERQAVIDRLDALRQKLIRGGPGKRLARWVKRAIVGGRPVAR